MVSHWTHRTSTLSIPSASILYLNFLKNSSKLKYPIFISEMIFKKNNLTETNTSTNTEVRINRIRFKPGYQRL